MNLHPPAARRTPIFEPLEPRRLCSAAPTPAEQLMIELVNRARADPAAEAQRLDVDLNEGLPPGTIAATPRPPLAPHFDLTDAARDHADWQLDHDTFGHAGAGGSTPGERIADAGYAGATTWGENLAFTASLPARGEAQSVARHHDDLFRDLTVPGRGHRINLLKADYREIGSGVAVGTWPSGGRDLPAVLSAQDFARRPGGAFLTGVAHTDAVADNDFYDVGEGLNGIAVTATRTADGATFNATTYAAGGYALALPPGTYDVSAVGDGLDGTVRHAAVQVGDANVKLDFRPDLATPGDPANPPAGPTPFAVLVGKRLTVTGTGGDDAITARASGDRLIVKLNGEERSFRLAAVAKLVVNAGGGSDRVDLAGDGTPIGVPAAIVGGDGHDTLLGGSGDDTIVGDGGDDVLDGRGGRDKLHGGRGGDALAGSAGNDTLVGDLGGDRLEGGSGRDHLDGAAGPDRLLAGPGDDLLLGGTGNDTLYGESGDDALHGQNQNDYLDGGDGADLIDGGHGRDTASYFGRPRGVRVTLGAVDGERRGDDGEPGEADHVLETVENVAGGRGNDFLVGSAFANALYGYGGDDTLDGGAGPDTLFGGDGDDAATIDRRGDAAELVESIRRR